MKLELLTDYNMYVFIEKGMRGGISTEMRRYCKANNPYLHDYNPEEEISYIIYLDEEEWMSPYQQSLARELNLGKDRTQKLLLTLRDKKKYVLHVLHRNLQLYLKLEMKLKKVHNVLTFDQIDWVEPYIRLNIELRKKAT